MSALVLAVLLAAQVPAPAPTPLHSGFYTLRVPPGETKAIGFAVPPHLAGSLRAVTFTWRVVRPTPATKFVFMEHCVDADRCLPSIMQPTGQGSGTLQSVFRIVNRSRLDLDVEIRYAVWDAR
ncbi:MAG: hypothetical protein ACRDGN_15795 [bacterium]